MPAYAKKRVKGKGDYVTVSSRPKKVKGKGDYVTVSSARPRKYLKGKGDYRESDYTGRSTGDIAEALAHRGASWAIRKGRDVLTRAISAMIGSGDYKKPGYSVKQNTLWNLAEQIPQMHASGHSTVIRHREYLGDIISSASAGQFKIQSFVINPGFSASFPWLYSIATQSFQKYKIRGMIYEFRSMSADALNSVNTALGTVIMSTNYSAVDAPFQSKAQMENTDFGMSARTSQSMVHPIECDPRLTPLSEQYIVNGTELTAARYDPRMDDLGIFYIASQGCQGTSVNLGELWVSYDIELITPIQNPLQADSVSVYGNIPSTASTNVSSGNLFGLNNVMVFRCNNIGMVLPVTGNTITIPAQQLTTHAVYFVSYTCSGTVAAACTPPSLTATNLAAYNFYQNNVSGGAVALPVTTTTQSYCQLTWMFQVVDPAAVSTITFIDSVLPSGTLTVDFFIQQLNGTGFFQ